jgi:hypothetical protein
MSSPYIKWGGDMMLGIDLSPIYGIASLVIKGLLPVVAAAILVKKSLY